MGFLPIALFAISLMHMNSKTKKNIHVYMYNQTSHKIVSFHNAKLVILLGIYMYIYIYIVRKLSFVYRSRFIFGYRLKRQQIWNCFDIFSSRITLLSARMNIQTTWQLTKKRMWEHTTVSFGYILF